jgi:hypothetical protein
MKIIYKDTNILIGELHVIGNPALILSVFILMFILIYLAFSFAIFSKGININTLYDLLFAAVFLLCILSFISFCLYMFDKLYTVEVKIDKESNVASFSNVYSSFTSWFYWKSDSVKIPISLIRKIEYHAPSPMVNNLIGKVVFIISNHNEVNLLTYDVDAGKQLADYINVPCAM